ncbi:MAG: hypothetical protein BGO86_03870 [Chryseobacterium sp. 36-9]|nr:MAG: hypothetical protein BGO86_03870 [Chryseobacterium sp. 36-9]
MKKLLIYILGTVFLLINCQNKTENILINVKYVGNYDHAMDTFLTNDQPNIKIDNAYQSIYEVKNKKILEKVKDYVIENHSKNTYRTNKLKVAITVNRKEKNYFFNSKDGIKFIDFLIQEVSVKTDPKNQYSNDEYFKTSELPPFKNQLKAYSGREWMYEKKP